MRAKPIAKILNLPQCEADRHRPYANDEERQDKRCKVTAKFVIEGTNLCQKHAQQTALDMLLQEGEPDE